MDAAALRARLAEAAPFTACPPGGFAGSDPAAAPPLPPEAVAVPAASPDGIELSEHEMVPAAVLVPIVLGPQPGVLLTKRTDHLRRHAGQVSFPGGRIDPSDASAEAAALREAWEEIGLDPAIVELAGRLPDHVTGTGFRVTPVLGLVPPGLVLRLSPDEVAAVFELKLSVLLDPDAPRRRRALLAGRWREFWVWPHEEHDIWGATAAILVRLAAMLRGGAVMGG